MKEPIWNANIIMSYKNFALLMDNGLDSITESLPRHFSSSDFIKVVKDSFPEEYAAILRQADYRSLHSWIARWYLNKHFTQIGEEHLITIMGHKNLNKLWRK